MTSQHLNIRVPASRIDNIYLVEFKEMPFKCFKDFQGGLQILIDSPLRAYLDKFIVIQPDDHPMLFFYRQVIHLQTLHVNNTVKNRDNSNKISKANACKSPKINSSYVYHLLVPYVSNLMQLKTLCKIITSS